ncbi:hypothetical protein [Terrabacter sp. NPDC080008]|uniref:hypothetical protein n=1 Tax=Terrabacter sp. NPDC080008 TaxID=3155176 RepID=UPI00344D0487
MDIFFFALMFVAFLAALGPHHRRTFTLPRAPFGADALVDRDLERVLHDAPADDRASTIGADSADTADLAGTAARRGRRHVRGLSHDDHPADRDRPTGLGLLRLP